MAHAQCVVARIVVAFTDEEQAILTWLKEILSLLP